MQESVFKEVLESIPEISTYHWRWTNDGDGMYIRNQEQTIIADKYEITLQLNYLERNYVGEITDADFIITEVSSKYIIYHIIERQHVAIHKEIENNFN